MIFDLRGKRRRAVQFTYAGLAALMAIGLLGAGVGSGVSGGIFDIFTGNNGTSLGDANKPVKKKIDQANARLKINPRDTAALIQLVRGHYTLATADTDSNTGAFGKKGKAELAQSGLAWKRYLATKPTKVDPALAALMATTYGPLGVNQPANATEAAEIVAQQRNDASSYIQLVQYATLAGQKRKADLAAAKALELAPKGQRAAVKAALDQAKATQPATGAGGTGQAPNPSGTPTPTPVPKPAGG
jgi:hypothetical protein